MNINKFTLLLIDDVPSNLHSLSFMIRENFDNIKILTALNANEAIQLIMQHQVDLILSDVQMPEISGLELANYLNMLERTKHIPIIFITGKQYSKDYIQEAYKAGVIEYISKPIDDELLCAKLQVFIHIYKSKKQDKEELIHANINLKEQLKTFESMHELSKCYLENRKEHIKRLNNLITRDDSLLKYDNLDNLVYQSLIQNAIKNRTVFPVFQPIVNQQKETIKYEVLMRIESDNHIYKPKDFLKDSLKVEQYTQLTHIMLEKAFKIMDKCDKDFSINLSFSDICNKTIINIIKNELSKYPQLASRLILEILESEEITNYDLVNNFIHDFKKLDVRIALDDFGAGYSNFEHLINLDVDYVKIDSSLIKTIEDNKKSFILTKSIVDFAKDLNLKTVAEYVCSENIFKKLKSINVDEYQGYYFSYELKSV